MKLFRRAVLPIFSLIASAWAVFPLQARADFVLHHWEDHYEPYHGAVLEGDLLYYSSTQNDDINGNTVTPTGSNGVLLSDYHRLGVDILGQFGLFDRFSLFGRVSWARFQVDSTVASASTYGFADQSVGGDYRVLGDSVNATSISLDLQAQADLPAYSNSTNQANSTPYQGDGSVDLSFGGFLTVPVKETDTGIFSLQGGLGYTSRSSHYSAAMPWNITANYAPKPSASGVLLDLSAFGVTSLKTDSSSLISQEGGFLTGSGGSFITNAINPSNVILRGKIGYQFDSGNQLLAAVDQSMWGQNSPVGTDVILGFRLDLERPSSVAAESKTNRGLEQFTLDAKVTQVNDRLNLVKIDKGAEDGVAEGQIFEIFPVNEDGTLQEAVGRCKVTSVKSDEAALTVIEYFKEEWINSGFVAKRLAQ